MKVNVIMPKMGESVMEGTIIKWHKKVGDKIDKDEILFEISTDKVDTEVPSPESGILKEIKVFEQETVDVDTVVAVIETEGGAIDEEEQIPSTTQVGGDLIDIPMPKMGESVMEGTIIKWHKKVGDTVKKDETLFEITTDKVDTEVPSPVEGTVAEILVGEQETVEIETIVARISAKGAVPKAIKQKSSESVEKTSVEETPAISSRSEFKREKSNRFYSPLVLNIARKENISFEELDSINGSGIGGRVTKKDVLAYLKNRGAGVSVQPKPAEESKPAYEDKDVIHTEREDIITMDNVRKRIMEHMIKSRDTSVHVTGVMEVDMTSIYNYIQKNRESFQREAGIKLTYMPFISYAAVKALKQYPLVNAQIEGDKIRVKKYVNLGIAVAVEPNGLIVPNIKNADEMNIKGLAKAIADLGNKARNKGLKPDDVVDGTFSITNYGVFGTLFGTPIINQPEVAILGVGTVVKKPVVITVNGQDTIAIKPMMYITLSHDHRLVDGMLGGRFLKAVKDNLENFDVNAV